jgi:hypothetical protein
MSKHTPGPWVTKAQGDANHYFMMQPNGRWLAFIQFNGELLTAEQETNACLIAAAPELLAAAKLALEYWAHREQRYKNRSPVWVQETRAAIAKATGGQA